MSISSNESELLSTVKIVANDGFSLLERQNLKDAKNRYVPSAAKIRGRGWMKDEQ